MVGLLQVLRQGFTDQGVKFRAVYWKSETSINSTTQEQFVANILHCTRQLHYSPSNENSIDIVLFVNGIPVVSMELKCQFTGQSTTNAIEQYKFDRRGKDAIFALKERLLEILNKYLHLKVERDKDTSEIISETMIFPRYHQLDVVTKLLADVKRNGSGKNYLIQHSEGSGKSNSIAWLAHRLAELHTTNDEKVFQSIIIVTDRKVLDEQLQNTVYQFEHVDGVVQKIEKNAQQLKTAINDGVPIIITTFQKFPVIYKEVKSSSRRFAVIVDEAHSSQTGDAAKKLKRALADTDKILEEYAQMEYVQEQNCKDDEDKLLDELAAQGVHSNMSFFAFTATPKEKTLNMFGWKDDNGGYHPFHVYSMRQAIKEGFILDV